MQLAKALLLLAPASLFFSCKSAEPTSGAGKAETEHGYGACHSQNPELAEQRAPSFLAEEQTCQPQDSEPARGLARRAGEGHINEKGDCAFAPSGIACHFHTAQEFLADPSSHEAQGVGELHCIVPTKEPDRPVVYGTHIRCGHSSHASAPAPGGEDDHTCKSGLMEVFSRCSTWKCCDNGTLTNPIATQSTEQRAMHPNFHMCADDVVDIDCTLLAHLHGHAANVPALGGIVDPVFAPTEQ